MRGSKFTLEQLSLATVKALMRNKRALLCQLLDCQSRFVSMTLNAGRFQALAFFFSPDRLDQKSTNGEVEEQIHVSLTSQSQIVPV